MSGIPVLHVEADCIARGWEESLIELNRNGCSIRTQYDKQDDPPSKDCTMMLTILDPLSEPMIHNDIPGGPAGVARVRHGDVRRASRITWSGIRRIQQTPGGNTPIIAACSRMTCPASTPFDQIETMCRKLAEVPYTRRAQAITWKVWEDNDCYDPPCLQNLWCRIIGGERATGSSA